MTDRKRRRRALRLPASDVAAVRSMLAGESVIDWHRLDLTSDEQIEGLLRVNAFDIQNRDDMRRLEALRSESVDYLRRVLDVRISPDVGSRMPAWELLRAASGRGRRQLHACMVLKVMHIIYHLDGHELQYRLPVSADELSSLVEAKVVQVVDEIRSREMAVREFSWSRKSRPSLITKLLAKPDTFASRVYDRLRFRIVVAKKSDLVPLIWELQHRIIPFNYVIPGESVNLLVEPSDLLAVMGGGGKKALGEAVDERIFEQARYRPNEFSSHDYRVVNFVADLPVRVEHFLDQLPMTEWDRDVVVTFVPAEFQILDWETARRNEEGDSSHEAYKLRQIVRVRRRLSGGRLDGDGTDRES